jgi:hypothetical protein
MDDLNHRLTEIQDIAVFEFTRGTAFPKVASPYQQIMPLFLIGAIHKTGILQVGIIGPITGSFSFVDPEFRVLKEIMITSVILMVVACNNDVHPLT